VTPYGSRKPLSEGIIIFWGMAPCRLVEGINVFEEPASKVFWEEERVVATGSSEMSVFLFAF
jgi:hypothetical protein